MQERALRILEFDKIIEQLSTYASSSLGQELVADLKPLDDPALIRESQRVTTEAVRILDESDRLPLGGLFDIRNSIKKTGVGGTLTAQELLEVASTLRASRLIRDFLSAKGESLEILPSWGARLSSYPGLEREIDRCIGPGGEILDSASSKLHSVRSQMKVIQNRIHDKLDSLIHSSDNSKYLQELLVTVRGDRYVIPVKQEYRSLFPGIVHDQSASGATLFIEPIAVVEMSNQLRIAQTEEVEEIGRILDELSGKVKDVAENLLISVGILARIDLAFAKGRYSLALKASEPVLNADYSIDLIEARHPLLSGKVVPIRVNLGRNFDTLVITGPNTGGKTVTLKTVGLLSLMAQSGLHIPAAPGSSLSVFEEICCDIGDEQSIAQNLSTFSSHLTQIIKIIAAVHGPNALVLLDELGAGTDPTEGAALAMSILTHLHRVGARTVATTHYSELKAFAYQTPGIENAAMEFDIDTLQPTYHLLIGLPGSSQAFAIAQKLGLPDSIIMQARGYISAEAAKVDEMLRDIEIDRRKARENQIASEAARAKGETFQNQYQTALTKFNQEKAELLRQARAEARQVLLETRRESENLLRRLREASPDELTEIVNQARQRITHDLDELDETPAVAEQNHVTDPGSLKPGSKVRVLSLGQNGVVLELNSDNALVQMGMIRANLPYRDLERLPEADSSRERMKSVPVTRGKGTAPGLETAKNISAEINLRGLTVDEGLYQLEKYLDQAILAGLHQIRVIHGKGTGALRQAVQQYLRDNPAVRNVAFAQQNEGGLGATVAELRN